MAYNKLEGGGKMSTVRRKLDAALKVQVVLEAIRGKRTITEIASHTGSIHIFSKILGFPILIKYGALISPIFG